MEREITRHGEDKRDMLETPVDRSTWLGLVEGICSVWGYKEENVM